MSVNAGWSSVNTTANEPRDELLLHVPGVLCGDPCPGAPDLLPCLLDHGHGGDWHQNRSSSWPIGAVPSEEERDNG